MPTQTRIETVADLEELAHRTARLIADLAGNSRGRFAICLSGGSTPRRLYQLLGEPPYREAMPWDRVHWFWGDERFVPWDHPDSNYRMAREALLAHVPAPGPNIHPDGHTASLFPGTRVLDEQQRWVAEVVGAKPEVRITLTYPTLESSGFTSFLVAGADKREALARVLAGDTELPAARLRPAGELVWCVDAQARPDR